MEKLDSIKIVKAFISEKSVEEGNPIYKIEQEFVRWVNLHTEFFIQRYAEGRGEHWTENELKTTRIGLSGQLSFELLLQLLEVPYVPNAAVIDQRLTKDYDFFIPKLGKVEVKCYANYCRKVLVKPEEWHNNDYLIVWKFREDTPNEEFGSIQLIGWLTKQEVEATPTTPKDATKFNPYSDAKIIDMTALRNPKTFITKLQKAKASMNQ